MSEIKNKNMLGTAQLMLAAFIWGSAFVAQSAGMEHIGPLTFASVRFFLGGIILLPLIFIRDRIASKHPAYRPPEKSSFRKLLISGIVCGILLTVASNLQQFGLLYTTVGKAGFITTLYVIFVPLCGLFFKERPSVNVWLAVFIATIGLYLLCMSESFSLSLGDGLVLLCAIVYTGHIVVVGKVSPGLDPIKLSCIQFLTVGFITLVPALVLETPDPAAIAKAWVSIAYAGILSSGVAFTLQVVAQRHTDSTIAAITMSFESVFAVLSGAVVLGQFPSIKEGIGCAVMFIAIILAQLPPLKLKKKEKLYEN